ncbi:PP-loop family-domain-containing protein [Elsinoe ampelina]|uniref:tRNA(Ile)-lysidine synthetase n=1 Tax=Elsinoe ampelina TaxID=302913 RepID=A0A6A6G1B1_9PEZI|nr:PP-loop family-domain-containing protein [Elsinoe ampelina]
MLRQALHDVSFIDSVYAKFHAAIFPVWRQFRRPPRMGIALSGGSDSIALAYLCHKFQSSPAISRASFTAFIVDHGVRPESLDEAQKVRNIILSKTGPAKTTYVQRGGQSIEKINGMDVKILKLDWTTHVPPLQLPNFESLARRLRYQALAKACIAHDISTLLLGHHADDQAETVLSRIASGYVGPGLKAIARVGDIPECGGFYGCKSGRPKHVATRSPTGALSIDRATRMIEDGGIKIHRPLLDFSKEQLRQICLKSRMKWVEDKTNRDPTLTVRNTVRSMLQEESMPKALSTKSLVEYANKRRTHDEAETKVVDDMFKSCTIQLDLAIGKADVHFPSNISDLLDDNDQLHDRNTRAARLLRRIVALVSPLEQISLKDMEVPARLVFPFLFSNGGSDKVDTGGVAPVGKVLFRVPSATTPPQGIIDQRHFSCQVSRAPPTGKDIVEQRKILIPEIDRRSESFDWAHTKRQLFDGRFWISLNYRRFNLIPGHRFSVRFLQSADLEKLNENESRYAVWKPLKELLRKRAPGAVRFTLPAIIESYYTATPSGGRGMVENLIALPTLDWSSAGWYAYDKRLHREAWTWELRYKQIDFGQGSGHTFVA